MRVPDVMRKCVVFIGSTTKNGRQLLRGTAFILGRAVKGFPTYWMNYFVTARHIIEGIRRKGEEPWLRVNTRDGKVDYILTKVDDWIVPESDASVDAAILWTAPGALSPFDHRAFSWDGILTPEVIEREAVGVGEDTFIMGLFVNHYGKNRNIPIMRVGNIAAMPEEKVHSSLWGDLDAYLIEARSISGLSGSPVFTFLGPYRMKETSDSVEYVSVRRQAIFHLIGLIHGHYDAASEFDLVDDATKQTRDKLNVGIAIVVPMTTVMEVFDQAKVQTFETNIEKEIAAIESATPGSSERQVAQISTNEELGVAPEKPDSTVHPAKFERSGK
jgi:hypothetical protein